jgi:hypothetical protein
MGLIVVVNGREQDAGKPRYRCECCPERTPFWDGEERAYERHVVACSQRHDEEMRGESLRVKAPGIFDPEQSGDVEFGKWIRQNREALLEDRMML